MLMNMWKCDCTHLFCLQISSVDTVTGQSHSKPLWPRELQIQAKQYLATQAVHPQLTANDIPWVWIALNGGDSASETAYQKPVLLNIYPRCMFLQKMCDDSGKALTPSLKIIQREISHVISFNDPMVLVNLTLFPWPHSQMPGACIPRRAKGSLPTIISPITSSLNTDRKEAMCLQKYNKKPDFKAIRSPDRQTKIRWIKNTVERI